MKSNLLKKLRSSPLLICLLTTQLFSFSSVFAKSSGGVIGGGGGDPRCSEYSSSVGTVVKALAMAGQDKIDAINPMIRLDDLVKIKQGLKCFPVEKLDRVARSYPSEGYTDLLVTQWQKHDLYSKINLAAHELAVLARYENDGEYYTSEDIIKIVRQNSKQINNLMSAEQVIENADGSVTLIRPFVVLEDKKVYFGVESKKKTELLFGFFNNYSEENTVTSPESVALGICKYLRYDSKLAYSLSKAKGEQYANVDANGHLLGFNTKNDSTKKWQGEGTFSVNAIKSFVYPFESVTCN